MTLRKFNGTGFDGDDRENSMFSDERLNTKIARDAKELKSAHDAAEKRKLSRVLRQDDPESWIGEDDE